MRWAGALVQPEEEALRLGFHPEPGSAACDSGSSLPSQGGWCRLISGTF